MNEGTGSCDWLHSLKSGSKLTWTLNQLKLLAATEAEAEKRDGGFERRKKKQKPHPSTSHFLPGVSSPFIPLPPSYRPPPPNAFVYAAILRLPPGSDIWRSPRSYCHPLTQLSLGITDTLAQHGGEAVDSPVGDKNKAPGLVKVSERAKGDI